MKCAKFDLVVSVKKENLRVRQSLVFKKGLANQKLSFVHETKILFSTHYCKQVY